MDSMHDKGRTFPDAKILNFPERTMSERKNVYRISNKDLEDQIMIIFCRSRLETMRVLFWK
jgi:hypothetical protein